MNLGDLLGMIRQDYLDSWQEAWDAAQAQPHAALEPALEATPTLGAELWADYHTGTTVGMVKSEGVFLFTETITFGWGDALPGQPDPLAVVVQPFAWDAMPFVLEGKDLDAKPLSQWLTQWATEPEPFAEDEDDEEEGEDEPFKQVVHGLKQGATANSWVADMGSAPLEAWQDLLEAILATGASRVVFGAPQKPSN